MFLACLFVALHTCIKLFHIAPFGKETCRIVIGRLVKAEAVPSVEGGVTGLRLRIGGKRVSACTRDSPRSCVRSLGGGGGGEGKDCTKGVWL